MGGPVHKIITAAAGALIILLASCSATGDTDAATGRTTPDAVHRTERDGRGRTSVPVSYHACINEKDTVQVAIEAYKTNYDGALPANAQALLASSDPAGNLSKLPKYWAVTNGTLARIDTATVPLRDCN